MAPFPLPLPQAKEALIFTGGTWLSNTVRVPLISGSPLEFLTLRVVHTELPAIRRLQFRLSYPALVPTGFCSRVSAPVGKLWLCICLSVSPILWAVFCPVPYLSNGLRKSGWFFSLLSCKDRVVTSKLLTSGTRCHVSSFTMFSFLFEIISELSKSC